MNTLEAFGFFGIVCTVAVVLVAVGWVVYYIKHAADSPEPMVEEDPVKWSTIVFDDARRFMEQLRLAVLHQDGNKPEQPCKTADGCAGSAAPTPPARDTSITDQEMVQERLEFRRLLTEMCWPMSVIETIENTLREAKRLVVSGSVPSLSKGDAAHQSARDRPLREEARIKDSPPVEDAASRHMEEMYTLMEIHAIVRDIRRKHLDLANKVAVKLEDSNKNISEIAGCAAPCITELTPASPAPETIDCDTCGCTIKKELAVRGESRVQVEYEWAHEVWKRYCGPSVSNMGLFAPNTREVVYTPHYCKRCAPTAKEPQCSGPAADAMSGTCAGGGCAQSE